MKRKKEMDIIIISPVNHLPDYIRKYLSLPEDAAGFTVVSIIKNQPKPSLEKLQELVGGYIERVPVYWHGHALDGWINEEGKILNPPMEPNLIGTALWYNTFLAQQKRPVMKSFSEDAMTFVKDAWRLTAGRDYIAGPLVIYSSMFREALRHAPEGTTLQ